jgi:hypothetical protein
MSDPEDLRREFETLVTRLEEIIAQNRCEDVEIQRADLGDLRTEGGRMVLYVQGKV